MEHVLSTYLFSREPLGSEALAAVARAGIGAVELYSAPGHVNYRSPEQVRELGRWLEGNRLALHSVHSPMDRGGRQGREGGAPISIAEPERLRRIDAVDEIKRALEIAEQIPFRCLVQHVGSGHEPLDDRHQEAAFNSLEILVVFARQRGVKIALENTPGDLSSPDALMDFLRQTRLADLGLCFDTGHARLGEGVEPSFERMRDRVVTTHIHDNHGELDEHLVPFEGSIDWEAALRLLANAPAELPLVLELKEPAAGGWAPALERAAAALERMETIAGGQPRPAGRN
ncbi:MAG TPA: sugar phosphate isomerase/epimerase family protein [Candidatus Acidoferrales bacterium]|nr:sugar phosphate isomerase/epimerase family protein [Candidatus Acidoferrales bacterium]